LKNPRAEFFKADQSLRLWIPCVTVRVQQLRKSSGPATSAFKCERQLIQQAFSLNHSGKMLVTIIDDAHLMDMENLRKLRLL